MFLRGVRHLRLALPLDLLLHSRLDSRLDSGLDTRGQPRDNSGTTAGQQRDYSGTTETEGPLCDALLLFVRLCPLCGPLCAPSALFSMALLDANSRVRRAATKSAKGGSLWKAIFSHCVARVHATKASPNLLTTCEPRAPSNDTTQPSSAVIPWDL